MTFAGGSLRDAHLSLSIAYLVCSGAIFLTAVLCFSLKPQPR